MKKKGQQICTVFVPNALMIKLHTVQEVKINLYSEIKTLRCFLLISHTIIIHKMRHIITQTLAFFFHALN